MASIRRTQSPAYYDRSHLNGLSSSSSFVSSPSHKLSSSSPNASPSLSALAVGFRRFLMEIFFQKYSRKGFPAWKRCLYRFFFCFVLGFLLGFTPFFNIGEIRDGDFPFGIRSPSTDSSKRENRVVAEVKPEGIVSLQLSTTQEINEEKFNFVVPGKLLIVVTPTYNRALQAYYLNRLAQTLKLVSPPLLWIVVEADSASMETAEILRNTGVMYRHMVSKKNSTDIKDRGVHQRNAALELIELHRLDGIVYFADDDNIYSFELFEQMREIKRFGTWPVAMLTQGKAKTIVEGPVCNGTQIIGWHTNEKSKRLRRFHVDMSGFAFNSTILWDPKRWHLPTSIPIRQLDTVKEGFQETTFIQQVVADESQMEGLTYGCSRIMNWHLHLEAHGLPYPKGWLLEKGLDVVVPLKQ